MTGCRSSTVRGEAAILDRDDDRIPSVERSADAASIGVGQP
jgi:hypothetical protein